jgi:two-component sensor histidine kinase
MCPAPNLGKPVVEESPRGDEEDLTHRALRQRIRQQEILAELGVGALKGATFEQLLDDTARLTAEGLQCEYCKVLQYVPSENRLFVRAGVGWGADVVGHASVGADLESPGGFALRTGKPVISNHLENEERFRTPELLAQHGIRRAMNVILQGDGTPFGVLEVDSRAEGEFSEQDLSFLQGTANLLGMAIERERYELNLKTALDRQSLLLGEINHRVKNSLQVVASMLQLQASASDDKTLRNHLAAASSRVLTVGRAYERLAYDAQYEKVDLGNYLQDVVRDLENAMKNGKIHFNASRGIMLASDRAIPIALIVNELVTNAAKYAYPGRDDGEIWVGAEKRGDGHVAVTVYDGGVGLPSGFKPAHGKSLGTRLVQALSQQLDASLSNPARDKGAAFELVIPLEPPDQGRKPEAVKT